MEQDSPKEKEDALNFSRWRHSICVTSFLPSEDEEEALCKGEEGNCRQLS